MINKDERIIFVVNHLQNKFGGSKVLVKDYWDADLCAIGITNREGNCLIYISTFAKERNYYYVSLERVHPQSHKPNASQKEFDNLSLSDLESLVRNYFDSKTN